MEKYIGTDFIQMRKMFIGELFPYNFRHETLLLIKIRDLFFKNQAKLSYLNLRKYLPFSNRFAINVIN